MTEPATATGQRARTAGGGGWRLLRGLLSTSADVARVLLDGTRQVLGGTSRWTRVAHDRIYVEVRGLHRPEAAAAVSQRLRDRLGELAGVRRVEINAALGVAVVVIRPDEVSSRDIVEVVETIEREHHLVREPRPSSVQPLPGDQRTALGEAVALAVSVTGVGLATVTRTARFPSQLGNVALTWVDATPEARNALETLVGARRTDQLLTYAGTATTVLTKQPLSLLVGVCHRFARLREEQARNGAWQAWDADHGGTEGVHDHPAPALVPRPTPLSPGAAERAASRIGLSAAPVSAAGLAITRSPARALSLLTAGTPKATRYGIESFAAALGRRLAGRGIVVLDPRSLRRLHRIDTVVIDAESLRWETREAPGEPDDDALDPLAYEVVAAARAAGRVLIAGKRSRWRGRFPGTDVVRGGHHLAESVLAEQAAGHGVALVSSGSPDALAAADLAIGVTHRTAAVPWAADVLCGHGLGDVWVLLAALPAATKVGTRSARLAEAATAVAAVAATAAPVRRAITRAALPINVAALLAFTFGQITGHQAGRRPVPIAVDRTPWHTLTAESAVNRLNSTMAGLPAEEATRREHQPSMANREVRPSGLLAATIRELASPLTPTLAIGAGLSAALGSLLDAGLIVITLGLNALIGGAERQRGDQALHGLVATTAVPAQVRRGDRLVELPAQRLVPGDVVELVAGDAVPADCRLLSAHDLEIDESSLTGESQPVRKTTEATDAGTVADRRCMVYRGTAVAAGRGRGLVVAIGEATEIGRASRLGANADKSGGVRARLGSLARLTVPLSAVAGTLLLFTDVIRGRRLRQALGHAIGLAVAAIPEGLPFVATSAELAAARRLSRRGVFVRNPNTVEALGRVNVLCFDKTGTLTEGRVRLHRVSDGHTSARIDQITTPMRDVLAAALRAGPDGHKRKAIPHATDRSVIEAADNLGVVAELGAPGWHKVTELPFEPSRPYHAVLGRYRDGQRLVVKGAPETVLDRCATWRRDRGDVTFDATARTKVERRVENLARQGYRVLAVAERDASHRNGLRPSRIDRLRLLGLLALADPARPAAAQSVRQLARAGIDFVMLTGDHPSTAESIAAELHAVHGRRVMTGAELDGLDDRRLARRLPGVAVFARVTPEQKARIVRLLRESGRVVAVTGDGANDAPAIRLADVGIALGTRATPAAREAADVIVTDDHIETIADAVVEGRAIWASVRDGVAILVGGNIGEIAFTVGAGLLGGEVLNVRQILLVNLLTDAVPAIAVAVRPPPGTDPEALLSEGPETSLGRTLTRRIMLRAAATAGAATIAWLGARLSGSRRQAGTTGLVALVAAQLAQTLAVRGRTPLVVGSSLGAFGVLWVAVQVPGINRLCGCRALWPHQWAIALGAAAISTITVMGVERVLARTDRDGGRRHTPSARATIAAGQVSSPPDPGHS